MSDIARRYAAGVTPVCVWKKRVKLPGALNPSFSAVALAPMLDRRASTDASSRIALPYIGGATPTESLNRTLKRCRHTGRGRNPACA